MVAPAIGDIRRLKLGKLGARHDGRDLLLEKYLDLAALPALPATLGRTAMVSGFDWGMDLNDQIGDCTIASVDHIRRLWNLLNKQQFAGMSQQDILAAYSAVSGYDPTTGQNDNGAVILDVLNYWRNTGIGGNKLGAFASVIPGHIANVKYSIMLFGAAKLGIQLPIAAQQQLSRGQIWDVRRFSLFGLTGIWAPGTWGGHDVPIIDWDDANQTFTCVTWGGLQQLTYRWFAAYCDESWACLDSEWTDGTKPAPNGFDLPTLQADLQAVAT
jgi:hypothetical protein